MANPPDDRTPAPAGPGTPAAASRAEIDAFLERVRGIAPAGTAGARGRLIFALDATMSRQPTWDTACKLQGEMFLETEAIGGLDVQLIYFRGMAECRASRFVSEPKALAALMEKIDCRGGHTQIRKVLAHARRETANAKVQALVYVGDAMEENIDELCARAGELGLLGVPAFVFQEGYDPDAERAFREIARLSRGAYCRFNAGAAHELRELLRAVAAYAAGGMKALADLSERRNQGAIRLLEQMEIIMPTLFIGLLALVLVLWLLKSFARTSPQDVIRIGRTAGGIVALAGAAFMGARGQLTVAVPLGVTGLGLLGWLPSSAMGLFRRSQPGAGEVSRVRSNFLEVTLDHDSGAMHGIITAGRLKGTALDTLELSALIELLGEFDAESRDLLAAYLDRRHPRWRENAQNGAAAGGGGPARSGKMTEEEAYQILGLQPGASADDIGRAHRGLMKKLHPDQGGSTYLAARVNEAKDVLLRRH